MCDLFEVSRSGYYAWKNRKPSRRSRRNAKVLERIRAIHETKKGVYGSPRIHVELLKEGYRVSRKLVARLMQKHRIRAKQKRRFKVTTDSKHDLPVAPNLLKRDFAVGLPDMTWLSDITYIRTDEGWLYLAATMDLFSRRIVGWSMDKRMTKRLVCNALRMATGNRRPGKGLIHHSDRGSQYASDKFRKLLSRNGMLCSMSRKGDCWDNAPMESFFHTLKTELIYHCRFKTREQAKRAVFEFIEVFYNRKRIHSALGYMTPVEFEEQTHVSKLVA